MDQTPTPTNNENKPFYQTKEFWMEVLRAAGVVVILAVIVLAGITVYKKLNDSDKSSDSDSENRSGLVSRSGDRFPKLKKGEELHIVVTDIKNLCRDENLLIFDEGGKVEFTVNPKSVSRFIGQKKNNVRLLAERGINVVVKQDESLNLYEIRIQDQKFG